MIVVYRTTSVKLTFWNKRVVKEVVRLRASYIMRGSSSYGSG